MTPHYEARIAEAEREAVLREYEGDCSNVAIKEAAAWDKGCVEGQLKGFERGLSQGFNDDWNTAREKARGIAESHKHIGPFEWDRSEQDKLAIYSNKTCEYIADRIASMSPTEPEK